MKISSNIDLSNPDVIRKVIKSCINGDKKGQHIIYQVFYGKMLAVCMRYASDLHEAQDILHDSFIKIFNKLKDYEFKGSFEGWVRKIVVNNCIDFTRRKKEFLVEEDNSFNNIQEENVIEEQDIKLYKKLQADTILKLMQKLPTTYRTIFSMYVIDNYSHNEIAQILNISVGASKSTLAKAKSKLKELFDDYLNEQKW